MNLSSDEISCRADLITCGKMIYDRGFAVASDGNLSHRIDADRIILTRSGVCIGNLQDDDLITICLDDENWRSEPVTSEITMHLRVYSIRPDVNAVIHAHPVNAAACSIAGVSLEEPVLPEIVMTLSSIPTTAFAVPSSPETADAISSLILNHNAIILDRHGTLTVGETLAEAFWNLERTEYAAQVMLAAAQIRKPSPLTPDQVERIKAAAEMYKKRL